MQRLDEKKSEPQKSTVHQLLDECAVPLSLNENRELKQSYMSFFVGGYAQAVKIVSEMQKASQLASLFSQDVDPCYPDTHGNLQLNAYMVNAIWGEKSGWKWFLHFQSWEKMPLDDLRAALIEVSATNAPLFSQLVRQHNSCSGSLLERALSHFSQQDCLRLIGRLSDATLRRMMSLTHGRDWYFCMSAANFFTDEIFMALVKKTPSVSLATAACLSRKRETMFEMASQSKSAPAFQVFLECLDHRETKIMINEFLGKQTKKLVALAKTIAFHQTAENFQHFLQLLEPDVIAILVKELDGTIASYETRFALRALQHKLNQHEQKAESAELQAVLQPLQQYDKKNSKDEKKSSPIHSDKERRALDQFSKGVFVKIVRADHAAYNPLFVDHLFDPSKPQPIRTSYGASKQGFKLLLAPEKESKEEKKSEPVSNVVCTTQNGFQIIKARTKSERAKHKSKKKKRTHTTKFPVTYISRDLNTTLFGYHADRDMVGYAFTVNEKNIKLLAMQDCDTFSRWWYNESLDVLAYAALRAGSYICKRFDEFVKRVDARPYTLNEALVKLHKEDLFAIVIAKDTDLARRVALERRLDILARFKLDLPILFYNPEKRNAAAYTSAEQRHDHPDLWVNLLRETIWQQFGLHRHVKGLFSRIFRSDVVRITIENQDYHVRLNALLAVLHANPIIPERVFDEIMKIKLNSPGDAKHSPGFQR